MVPTHFETWILRLKKIVGSKWIRVWKTKTLFGLINFYRAFSITSNKLKLAFLKSNLGTISKSFVNTLPMLSVNCRTHAYFLVGNRCFSIYATGSRYTDIIASIFYPFNSSGWILRNLWRRSFRKFFVFINTLLFILFSRGRI